MHRRRSPFWCLRRANGAAASLPEIVVQLFGVQALWVACIIGYLACFASLNIYIQSFARLVWSQAQYKPESYLARLSPATFRAMR
jgi:amino acid efflux transporter